MNLSQNLTQKLSRQSLSKVLKLSTQPNHAVIILAASRTGSSLLSTYLGSLNGFKSYGEILNPGIYPFLTTAAKLPIKKWLALLKLKFTLAEDYCSVKLIFNQFEALSLHLNDLERHFPTVRFLIMYRESLIDRYLSWLKANKTKEWFSKSSRNLAPSLSFRIEPEQFLDFCRETKAIYQKCNIHTLLNRSAIVEYSQLIAHPQVIFREEICPFLDLNYEAVKTPLKKQNSTSLSDTIENFDEIHHLLQSEAALLRFDRHVGGFY